MSRKVRYTVTIAPRADMDALLDMLRYEGATVADWGIGTNGSRQVTILSEHYVPERWASFGITPRESAC